MKKKKVANEGHDASFSSRERQTTETNKRLKSKENKQTHKVVHSNQQEKHDICLRRECRTEIVLVNYKQWRAPSRQSRKYFKYSPQTMSLWNQNRKRHCSARSPSPGNNRTIRITWKLCPAEGKEGGENEGTDDVTVLISFPPLMCASSKP